MERMNNVSYLSVEEVKKVMEDKKQDISDLSMCLTTLGNRTQSLSSSSIVFSVIKDIEKQMKVLKKEVKSLQDEIKILENLKTKKQIEVMFFKAGHRGFSGEEISGMLRDIRKFSVNPMEAYPNFGMSDEAKMFVSEEVSNQEAQLIYNWFLAHMFDENDQEVLEYNELLIWNGYGYMNQKGEQLV